MSLDIEIYKSEKGKCRIELRGRLDTDTSELFDQRIASISLVQHPVQVVDLAGLDYISSAGVRSLFKAEKALALERGQLLLVNPQPQVKKVLEVIQALPAERLFTSQRELDHYLDSIQKKIRDSK